MLIKTDGFVYFQGAVLCMSKLEETVNDADFIFECIPEDMDMKKDIFESMACSCCSKLQFSLIYTIWNVALFIKELHTTFFFYLFNCLGHFYLCYFDKLG